MDEAAIESIRELVLGRATGALGTLHGGAPFVSMLPFAVAADGSSLLVHVSRLAQHTVDMLRDPRVSFLIVQPESDGTLPQALERVTVQGEARELSRDLPGYTEGRAAYLARHPQAEQMFGFGDFSLFAIRPLSARYVGGFARAMNVSAGDLARALRR